MSLERRLQDALHAVDGYQPSPDLFARVNRSVDEDRKHRVRLIRNTAIAIAAAMIVVVFVASAATPGTSGRLLTPIWVMEVVESTLLLGLTFVLGPSIRRFGRNYVDDIFAMGGETGRRVLTLMDIGFYLVFIGFTLQSVSLTNLEGTEILAGAVEDGLVRLGVFLLMMGILHSLTLAVLPVAGLVFSSIMWRVRRRDAGIATEPSDRARRAERAAIWAMIALAVFALAGAAIVLPNLIVGVLGL